MRNTWYVAAWSEEIEPGQRLARTLLGRPTLLLRGSDGGVSVLDDRCPHRFAPLSLGRFDGQTITCGYHGMDFDAAGVWTRDPHDATLIPDSDDWMSQPGTLLTVGAAAPITKETSGRSGAA